MIPGLIIVGAAAIGAAAIILCMFNQNRDEYDLPPPPIPTAIEPETLDTESYDPDFEEYGFGHDE